MEEESNKTHTTCFCDHLTHFAVVFDDNDLHIPGNTSVGRALEVFSNFENFIQATSIDAISEQRASVSSVRLLNLVCVYDYIVQLIICWPYVQYVHACMSICFTQTNCICVFV